MDQTQIHEWLQRLTGAVVVEEHKGGGVFLDGTFYGIPYDLSDDDTLVRLHEIAKEYKEQINSDSRYQ